MWVACMVALFGSSTLTPLDVALILMTGIAV